MTNGLMGLAIGIALGSAGVWALIKQGTIPSPAPARIVSVPMQISAQTNELIRVDI